MDGSRPLMTHGELLALPTTVDLETGNRAFGLGRSHGYRLARENRYPCRVIKAGKVYRVPTADLRNVLGVAEVLDRSA